MFGPWFEIRTIIFRDLPQVQRVANEQRAPDLDRDLDPMEGRDRDLVRAFGAQEPSADPRNHFVSSLLPFRLKRGSLGTGPSPRFGPTSVADATGILSCGGWGPVSGRLSISALATWWAWPSA